MVRKLVIIILLSICCFLVSTIVFLDFHFYQTRPRSPEPKLGRIHSQFVQHGTRVYLTRVEKVPFDYFSYLFLCTLVIAYVLNKRWRCIGFTNEEKLKG